MKIVVGLPGTINEADLHQLAEAGAGEFFVGYVPRSWSDRFGYEFSPNRRYFREAQLTAAERLLQVCRWAADAGIPVSLTFNEHLVTRAAWELGQELISEAVDAGIGALIVADPTIIAPVRQRFPELALHLSGDAGTYNAAGARLWQRSGITRLILPRELSLADIDGIGAGDDVVPELEAFVMGEPCVYDGARCFTEHGYGFGCDFCNDHQVKELWSRRTGVRRPLEPPTAGLLTHAPNRAAWALGKCGLCALPRLRAAGVTHVKVPGRASNAVTAIRLVRQMLASPSPTRAVAQSLLHAPELCVSGTFCYYPEVLDD